MKRTRKFLTTPDYADSYLHISHDNDGVNLKLADCEKHIHLWFCTKKLKHAKTSLKKLAVLQSGLDIVKAGLEHNLKILEGNK